MNELAAKGCEGDLSPLESAEIDEPAMPPPFDDRPDHQTNEGRNRDPR